MAEVSDVLIKRTQDTLGKQIKKPVLTDKLLRKPPFRFIHDIIHAVIKANGFFDGLFSEDELKPENIKDRNAKIEFLQKTIDVLEIATKQSVKARPSKIVAGLEADKTNELLIAIGKAIDRKIDTTEAVALVKSGNVNAIQKKDLKGKTEPRKINKEAKEPTSTKKSKTNANADVKPQKKIIRQSTTDSTDSKKKVQSQSKEGDKDKNKGTKKVRESKISPKKEDAKNIANSEPVEKNIETSQINENVTKSIGDAESISNIPEERGKTVNESVDTFVQKGDVQHDKSENPENKSEEKRNDSSQKAKFAEKAESLENPERFEKSPNPPMEEKKIEKKLENKMDHMNNEKKISEPDAVAKTELNHHESMSKNASSTVATNNVLETPSSDHSTRSSKSKKSHTKHENPEKILSNASAKTVEKLTNDKINERPLAEPFKSNEITKNSKPRAALRSAALRPISARPSAPRRRDRNVRQILQTESFVQESSEQYKSKKNNIISDFDDTDNIIVTETISDNISMIDDTAINKENDKMDGKQGHLVQQILETQTTILKSDAKNDATDMTDESILNDRKSITRNMTELRKIIQKLSLYITPLGKMMEYFQEDVDAMHIELLMWQKACMVAETDIKEEQRTTEKLLENFRYQLAEINNSIKDHAEQINNTTMNIIQNEEKISKVISTF